MDQKRRVLPLVRRATRLEEEAELALFFRREQAALVRYAARLSDPDSAEDIVQDAMLKFLAQREREVERGSEGVGAGAGEPQWAGLSLEDVRIRLMVMVHDVAIDRQRAQKKESRMMRLITGPTATVRRWMNPRRATDDDAIRTAIRDILLQLPAHIREPWIQVRENGYTVEEAAALLGYHPKSIRASIAKANQKLRERLAREGMTPSALRGRDD